jgi:hypothetical protein
MRISDYHVAKCGVEGKCSVPMWSGYGECFCDEPAWGEQYSEREPSRGQSGKYANPVWPQRDRNGYYPPHLAHLKPPYAPSLACKAHGGPGTDQIRFVRDGNMWCAFMPGFENLQESVTGFGETQDKAEVDLRRTLIPSSRREGL